MRMARARRRAGGGGRDPAIPLLVNSRERAPVMVVCESGTPGCELRQPVHWRANFALYIWRVRYDFDQ